MPLPAGVYRAAHVGSLLRPKEVLAARNHVVEGQITPAELRVIEDRYIAIAVKDQLAAGLRSITDGEFRRRWFHVDFLQHLAGIEYEGHVSSSNTTRNGMTPPRLVVKGRLGHPKSIQVDDFLFLQKLIAGTPDATAKVCIPSPTMVHFRGGRDTIDETAYPDLDAFFDDLVAVYRAEIDDLYEAGCRFVQFDDTNLAYLCDEDMRADAEKRHGSAEALTERYASLINATVAGRPNDMIIGIHLCRGNYRSQWFAQGGYEPVAEVLFGKLDVDVYFLEFDDARSGDFSPLRHLPEDKVVVLGVMSSKKAALDDKVEIVRRLHEAARFCPGGLDQLCLSHQCGFSSTSEGNDLTAEEQYAKIKLSVEIARELWGHDRSE